MDKVLEKLFTSTGEQSDFVKPYSFQAIRANLNVKIESLVEAMKTFISNQTDGFSSATASGFILNSAFVASYHGGMTQELEAIMSTEKKPSLSGLSEDSNLVLLPYEDIPMQPTIAAKIRVDKVQYTVCAEGRLLVEDLDTISDAVHALFGILFIGSKYNKAV